MTWNYRVIESESGVGTIFAIHEVYYDKDDNIESWTENPVSLEGYESVKELLDDLGKIAKDAVPALLRRPTSRPVLKMSEMGEQVRDG